MEYVVLAQGRERRWKRSQDVSSVWSGNLVLRNYPPIGIWVDKGPKSEKMAENCTFFFVYVVYRNIGLTNIGVIAGLLLFPTM